MRLGFVTLLLGRFPVIWHKPFESLKVVVIGFTHLHLVQDDHRWHEVFFCLICVKITFRFIGECLLFVMLRLVSYTVLNDWLGRTLVK